MNGSITIHLYFIKYIKQLFGIMDLSMDDNAINMNYLADDYGFYFYFYYYSLLGHWQQPVPLPVGAQRWSSLFPVTSIMVAQFNYYRRIGIVSRKN